MHEKETRRGWVCTSCAVEATGVTRQHLYRWKNDGKVAIEPIGRQTFWNLEQLLEAEATRRPPGRPVKQPRT